MLNNLQGTTFEQLHKLNMLTQETADFSEEQGCISSKHVTRSDLIPERKSPFFDNDG